MGKDCLSVPLLDDEEEAREGWPKMARTAAAAAGWTARKRIGERLDAGIGLAAARVFPLVDAAYISPARKDGSTPSGSVGITGTATAFADAPEFQATKSLTGGTRHSKKKNTARSDG